MDCSHHNNTSIRHPNFHQGEMARKIVPHKPRERTTSAPAISKALISLRGQTNPLAGACFPEITTKVSARQTSHFHRECASAVLVSFSFKIGGICRIHGTAATINGTATQACVAQSHVLMKGPKKAPAPVTALTNPHSLRPTPLIHQLHEPSLIRRGSEVSKSKQPHRNNDELRN